VCCSVLQCVAVCCSVLQCVAVCCSVLQCVAVTWLIHMCDMTDSCLTHTRHSCVWHDSFICVTWIIHTCDMAHSYVRLAHVRSDFPALTNSAHMWEQASFTGFFWHNTSLSWVSFGIIRLFYGSLLAYIGLFMSITRHSSALSHSEVVCVWECRSLLWVSFDIYTSLLTYFCHFIPI